MSAKGAALFPGGGECCERDERMWGENDTPVPRGAACFSATPGGVTPQHVETSASLHPSPAGPEHVVSRPEEHWIWHRMGTESPQSLAPQGFRLNSSLTCSVSAPLGPLGESTLPGVNCSMCRPGSRVFHGLSPCPLSLFTPSL